MGSSLFTWMSPRTKIIDSHKSIEGIFKSLSAFRDSQQRGFAIGNDDFGVTALR
jgi:hypothetical protein